MVRLIGIGLVWGGCILWGLRAAGGEHQRVRLLEDMGQALELLEREMALNRTALPELLDRLSRRNTRQGRDVFSVCKAQLEKGKSFACAWEEALERSGLKQEEKALLSCLSQVLGQYDAQGQAQAVGHLRQELERRSIRQREEACAIGRVYRILGVAAGGFLTLTLI